MLNLICAGWVLGDQGIPCSLGGGGRGMWPLEVSGPLSWVTGAHAKGLGQGHRSVGLLIRLCPGACRHSPQFVKRYRVTPEGLFWLPWPNTGLKHYQPPPGSLVSHWLPHPKSLAHVNTRVCVHTLNTSPSLIRGITPGRGRREGEVEAGMPPSPPHYIVDLCRIICPVCGSALGCLTPWPGL